MWLTATRQDLLSAFPVAIARLFAARQKLTSKQRYLFQQRLGPSARLIANPASLYTGLVRRLRGQGEKQSEHPKTAVGGTDFKAERGSGILQWYLTCHALLRLMTFDHRLQSLVHVAKIGILLSLSARSTGNNPWANLTAADKEDYWARQEVIHDPRIKIINAEEKPEDMLAKLAIPNEFL